MFSFSCVPPEYNHKLENQQISLSDYKIYFNNIINTNGARSWMRNNWKLRICSSTMSKKDRDDRGACLSSNPKMRLQQSFSKGWLRFSEQSLFAEIDAKCSESRSHLHDDCLNRTVEQLDRKAFRSSRFCFDIVDEKISVFQFFASMISRHWCWTCYGNQMCGQKEIFVDFQVYQRDGRQEHDRRCPIHIFCLYSDETRKKLNILGCYFRVFDKQWILNLFLFPCSGFAKKPHIDETRCLSEIGVRGVPH